MEQDVVILELRELIQRVLDLQLKVVVKVLLLVKDLQQMVVQVVVVVILVDLIALQEQEYNLFNQVYQEFLVLVIEAVDQ